jgi:hypothetical protein
MERENRKHGNQEKGKEEEQRKEKVTALHIKPRGDAQASPLVFGLLS